jgi:hypothetical protein
VGRGGITSSMTVTVGSNAGTEAEPVWRFAGRFAWQPETRRGMATSAERISRLMELVSGLLGLQSGLGLVCG